MATEAPPSYTQVSTRDENDAELPSDALEHVQDYNSSHIAEMSNVPLIEISPPPSPPTRVQTGDSYISVVTLPLSYSNIPPLEESHTQAADQQPRIRSYSSLTLLKERVHGSFTPSLHELLERKGSDPITRRQYNRGKQRHRLWRLTIGEFFNTLMLCLGYFGILYAYSKMERISVPQRRVFNALTTGISLVLGVNLAASLRSYSKLLRWRMLAVCYRPLETFDLVLGCDSLMNVIKLLWKARNTRYKFLPSRTQIICFTWLLVHLAVTILVGIIGLNYNLNDSTTALFTQTGIVSIVDLNALSTGDFPYDLAQIQQWGVRGEISSPLDISDALELQQAYFSDSAGYTLYFFQDQNANDPTNLITSTRYIESQAYCTGYTVSDGQYGNLSYIIYNDGNQDVNKSLPAIPGPAGLVTISKLNSTCGERCVDMYAFQAATVPGDTEDEGDLSYTIPEGKYFVCNNTVPQVEDDDNTNLTEDYLTYDFVGRMLAGAIGWSDLPPVSDDTAEYAVYTNSSQLSFGSQPAALDMANVISQFTMGAISFMDNSPGMYRKNVTSKEQPIVAQVLDVKWKFAGAILGVIPFIHFLTLGAVIIWANKAIIKDDSHLAIAKLYHRLLSQLGENGCLLRGDEVAEVLENPKVAYGWQASDGASSMHVDVFKRGGDLLREETPFMEGWYNGDSKPGRVAAVSGLDVELRRRYRDIDAADYF